jgi:predicted ATP-dependent endonuclease of OLD family
MNALFGENEVQERRLFYIPAGRSLLSSFKQAAQSKIMNGSFMENTPFSEKSTKNIKSHFEFFVRDFFERIDTIKTEILYGKTLEEVIATFALLENRDYSKAKAFHQKIKQILKADYQVDAYGERLVSAQFAKSIKLDFASSGQQEVIWILLQLFVLILENRPSFIVIEEPEAHLYPSAQVEIMNLIALFLNAHPDNQVIVTTHSPYMLTAANNLLFAHRVANKVGKEAAIAEAIGTESWINPNSFGAYYLSDNDIIDIFNKETGVIAESELDDASENIMSVFDNLMNIYKA